MKKRKPPILLLSMLAVLIGALVIFGLSKDNAVAGSQDSSADSLHVGTDQAPTATDLAAQIKPPPQASRPSPTGELDPAQMAKTKHVQTGPKPMSETVSGQWYRH